MFAPPKLLKQIFSMKRIIVVSNRLPIRFEKKDDQLEIIRSEGGLATGLGSLGEEFSKEWIGWPGVFATDAEETHRLDQEMPQGLHAVHLSEEEINQYYEGFSNETIWPLFHYFINFTQYNQEHWKCYEAVNRKFCEKVASVVKPGDMIWVQDYHLMLLPEMLKTVLPANPVGFFLHIPFPSFELFRTLPWRKEILQGLLGADLIGFHTFEYMRHFTSAVYRILGHECDLGEYEINGRAVQVDAFPMGINFEKFYQAAHSVEVQEQVGHFREKFGDSKLILSVDRMDYTKGIINRMQAFSLLLDQHPELKEKVSFIMVSVPSRSNVSKYQDLKEEIDEIVGNINGRHGTVSWTPIHYLYRSVPFEQLAALYNISDICLITPLRDGMNLVAKEFVASKTDATGVLILSELAGAAIELREAVQVNPNDENSIVNAVYDALHMPLEEQQGRMVAMQKHLRKSSIEKWASSFINQLESMDHKRQFIEKKLVNGKETETFCGYFSSEGNKLVILDYDGTLQPFCSNPEEACPDEELCEILEEMNACATVLIISGRDHQTMEKWFGGLNVEMIAEHGIWHRDNGEWSQVKEIDNGWMEDVMPILQKFVSKTPGSMIEEKASSLVWHYRKTDSWLAEMRAPQLVRMLVSVCSKYNLDILQGNKVIEIKIAGIDKGTAAYKWLLKEQWDFIMAIGDDVTDEDIFTVMPENAHTIKVGTQPTRARYRIHDYSEVRRLLRDLAAKGPKKAGNGQSNTGRKKMAEVA